MVQFICFEVYFGQFLDEFVKFLRFLIILFSKSVDIFILLSYNKEKIERAVQGVRISYKKLWIMLIEKEVSQTTLRKDLHIASGTMTKLRRNEEVALSVLIRICEYLDCNIGDICDVEKNSDENIF